jgi:acyl carrier protein
MLTKPTNFTPEDQEGDQAELFEQVAAIIRRIADEDELEDIRLEPQTGLKYLGLDSIKFMNLILSIEDLVHKDIEEIIDRIGDFEQINTIQDVMDTINNLRRS